MSLQTVLKIGKALRSAEDNLKYFKYVENCPYQTDKEGNKKYPLCLKIPVKEDFSFDWDNVKPMTEKELGGLYYLKFKTSDSDGLVKYVFGDIYFAKNAKITKDGSIENGESGYYRLENPNHTNAAFRPSSFSRGINDYKEILKSIKSEKKSTIEMFHSSLEKNIDFIEKIMAFVPAIDRYFTENIKDFSLINLLSDNKKLEELTILSVYDSLGSTNLKKIKIESSLEDLSEEQRRKLLLLINSSVFIHFEFINSKHWYQFTEDVEIINAKILSDFVEPSKTGFVLKKTLYKTLCSGDKKNDIQFPHFKMDNKYKSKAFEEEDVQNLFYAIDYTNKGKLISNTNIKIITLPLGENLDARDYQDFLEKREEARLLAKNIIKSDNEEEPLFDFANDTNFNITSFDVIFCKKGGLTSPDSDLIEISGIEKSKLLMTMRRLEDIKLEINQERKLLLRIEKELPKLSFEFAFRNILGNPQIDTKTGKVSIKVNPKYESHLLKVLPLIYTDNYHHDEVLLPAFIQNVEYIIRNSDSKIVSFQYREIMFQLKYLIKIQNNTMDKFKEITDSESYKIGFKLGKLSKPLKKKINSFEKNYVGLVTRRVATKDDCVKFYNEINGKLLMHTEPWWGQSSAEIASELAALPLIKYDKEKLAFGFFEGYFKYEAADKKKDFFNRIEKICSDYEGNDELQEEVERLTTLLNEKNN